MRQVRYCNFGCGGEETDTETWLVYGKEKGTQKNPSYSKIPIISGEITWVERCNND